MSIKPSWRLVAGIAGAVVALAATGLLVLAISDAGLGALNADSDPAVAYFVTAALVFGDALIAVFPGETTLNTASILANDGELDLGLVILAGFLGAWLGDNTLYWIARSIPALHREVDKAQQDDKFKNVISQVSQNSFILVVVCRFLPFVRWGVVAGMGVLPMPYRHFLLADTIGCAAWAVYTCLMAYWIGNTLADFPVASLAVACASSGIILGIAFVVWRRMRRTQADAVAAQP